MARSARGKTAAKKKSVSLDFSQVGKQFEEDMEYALEVKACTLETGSEYPYFSFQFKGVDPDYENSVMYHNASTSPQSLWRLRPLLEAFGMDIPDGPMDLEAEDFVGMQCMASTKSESKPGGGTSIRPEDFWPIPEDSGKKEKKSTGKKPAGKSEKEDDFDLARVADADIKKLAKEFGIAGRDIAKLREELAKADDEELVEACEDLDIALQDVEDSEEEEKPSGRSSRGSKKSTGKRDSKPSLTEDEVQEMSEEELEDLIEQHELDVDLDDFKTLRRKKNAVIDALTENDLLEK